MSGLDITRELKRSYEAAVESARLINDIYKGHIAMAESLRTRSWHTQMQAILERRTTANAIVERLLNSLQRHTGTDSKNVEG